MAVDNDFTRIPDSDVDRDSPLIQRLTRAWTSNQNHAMALVRSDGSGICTGTADSVTDAANSVITDAAPSAGAVANVAASMVVEVVDGDAAGTFATALSTGASTITVDSNLVTAGMQAGDTYRVIYGLSSDMAHTHDGVDTPTIDFSNIANVTAGLMDAQRVTAFDKWNTPRTYDIDHNLNDQAKAVISMFYRSSNDDIEFGMANLEDGNGAAMKLASGGATVTSNDSAEYGTARIVYSSDVTVSNVDDDTIRISTPNEGEGTDTDKSFVVGII